MKIILTNKERFEVDNYILAMHVLNVKICKAVNEPVCSPVNLRDAGKELSEIGGTVTYDGDETTIEIPEAFVELYFNIVKDVMNDISEELTTIVRLGYKYSNVVDKAIKFLSALDVFGGPLQEVKNALVSFKRVFKLTSDKQDIRIQNYLERIRKG